MLLLAACGGEEDVAVPEQAYASGSRLRAEVYDLGDGTQLFQRWRDSERNVVCTFMRHRSGGWYCLPWDESERSWVGGELDIAYLDAGCSQPVRTFKQGVAIPAEVLAPANGTPLCNPSDREVGVFALGERLADDTQLFLPGYLDGTCEPLATVSLSYPAYQLGGEVSPDGYVAAEEREEPGASLASRALVGDDGSFERIAIVDAERDATCQAWWTPNAPCTAGAVAWMIDEHADPACTTDAAYSSEFTPAGQSSCGTPTLALQAVGACEDADIQMFELGRRIDRVYSGTPSLCGELLPDASHVNFAVGAMLPADARPRVRDGVEGDGRLRLKVIRGDDGRILPGSRQLFSQGIHDDVLAADCVVSTLCDGSLACLPSVTLGWFADPQCTQPLVELSTDCALRRPGFVGETDGTCATGAVAEVGAVYEGYELYGPKEDCLPNAYVPTPGTGMFHLTPSSSLRAAAVVSRVE